MLVNVDGEATFSWQQPNMLPLQWSWKLKLIQEPLVAGRVILVMPGLFHLEFVAKREVLERLSVQLSDQLTKAPLPLDHR